MEATGLVELSELPDKEVFVELDSDFVKGILSRIKQDSCVTEFAKKIAASERILLHWFAGDSQAIRLDVLKTVLRFLEISLETIEIKAK